MKQKTKINEKVPHKPDTYGPHDAALELKKTLQSIIITLERSDNLDRKQLKEKFKNYISKSQSLPTKHKFSALARKKNSTIDDFATFEPEIVSKKSVESTNSLVTERLSLLRKYDKPQEHIEKTKKISLAKETAQLGNLSDLPKFGPGFDLPKFGPGFDLPKFGQGFDMPPPPPPPELLNRFKKNKPKNFTITSSNKTTLKKNIGLPWSPMKNNKIITKLKANKDTIPHIPLAEKQTSQKGTKKDVFSEKFPKNFNKSVKKKDLNYLTKTVAPKNLSKSKFTIKSKKKNVSVVMSADQGHAVKENSNTMEDTLAFSLDTQNKDGSHSDTFSSESDNTSDTQKNLDHYRDSVGKFSSEVTDEKKKLVDKAKFKRHKKNVLDSGVFESKTDSFSRKKRENKTTSKKKNSIMRRNSLTNSLSGEDIIQKERIAKMKKEELIHESDNDSLSHSPKSVKLLRAMENDQKSVSSRSLDEVFLTLPKNKSYEPGASLGKKTNINFLNCLSGISTHFSDEAQQMSASEDTCEFSNVDSLALKKKASGLLEEPHERRTSLNIGLTNSHDTKNTSNSVLTIHDSMNSEDDSKNLKKRNQNAANKRALSFNENPLPEKLTNSIYTKQQNTGYPSNEEEEEHRRQTSYILNDKILSENDFLKKNMSFKNLHFYESLVQNYNPNEDLWTLKDAFQIIHGPFSATELVHWIRHDLLQCHSDVRFCREGKEEYLSLKETLPYLTAAQIVYDKQRLSYTKPDQYDKDRLPQCLVNAEKICVQYDVDSNGSFLSGLKPEWRRKRDNCFPDTQVVLLPINSTTTKWSFFNEEMPPPPKVEISEETIYYLEESQNGFIDWAQANNMDLPQKKYLIPMNSTVLKFASPIFEAVLGKQEKRRLERKETIIDSEFMYTLVIACINPEATQLLFRSLYQSDSVFDCCEPIFVLCAYHEATRFRIEFLQNKLVKCLLGVRNIEVIIILSSITEALQHWNLLAQFAVMLCNCAYSVFSNKNYLKLGPLTLRFILGSKLCSLDEIQLLVAVYKWLEKWRNHRIFVTQNFYENFQLFQTHLSSMINSEEFNLDYDDSLEFNHMSPIEQQSLNKIFFYSSLRLCQMSPKELSECRYLIQLDTLLLDAFLRKALHKEMPRRVLLWNNSHHFILNYKNGLFPVSLTRVQPRNLPYVNISEFKNFSLTQGNQPHQGIPPYYRSTDKFWVSVFGDFRMLTQACWGVQVLHTKEGSISVGAVSEEMSNLLPAGISTSPTGHVLWYFNCFTRQFYTALINLTTGKVTCRLAMTPYLSETRTEAISTGSIIVVHYSVGVRNIWMTVAFHNPEDPIAYYRASFNFLHQIKPVKYDELGHRYTLSLAPWNELKDYNDSLGIPDITMSPSD